MNFKKKGQGLSLNTIIIAAIVLIVLVVLWAVFTGRMGKFSQGLTDITREKTCAEAGGIKMSGDDCGDDTPLFGKYTDIKTGDICCKTRGGTCEGDYQERTDGCRDFKDQGTCPSDCNWVPVTT